MEVNNWIRYWKFVLGLEAWTITTQEILREQVIFPDDIEPDEEFFIGIDPDIVEDRKSAVLIHDQELTEHDIIHELLHIAFPEWTEEKVVEYTDKYYQNRYHEKI